LFHHGLKRGVITIRIQYNDGLLNLSGLDALFSVDGEFIISNNSITDVTGLSTLSFVRSLRITSNPNLTNLDGLSGLSNIENSLSITSNPQLTSILGLSALSSVPNPLYYYDSPIYITSNPLLNLCYAEGICNLLGIDPNSIQFGNNETGCNSETEVQNLCDCVASETETGEECPIDCEGTLNGAVVPGTPCEDGDVNTINDIYQPDCSCAGTPSMAECSDTFILEFPANH